MLLDYDAGVSLAFQLCISYLQPCPFDKSVFRRGVGVGECACTHVHLGFASLRE